ncbi:acyl-CoA dehydrogenase family protein [Paenibacillus pinisoli]|nr:acyl-CoA dehydrogenase family protein [Paenibacillus pinisoli]
MKLWELVDSVSGIFADRAGHFDETREFPFENYNLIVENHLHAINLPEQYGGLDLGIEETTKLLSRLAMGCGQTTLSLAMHYYSLGGFKKIFSETMKEKVLRDIAYNGKFMASISNPNILLLKDKRDIQQVTNLKGEKVEGGFIVNGEKRFVSGSPAISYLPIYCVTDSSNKYSYGISAMMCRINDPGIEVQNTWNLNAMRTTASHNIRFTNVFVPNEMVIGREGYGIDDTQDLIYWFRLSQVSVYYGMAVAAYEYIKSVVHTQKDHISNRPISFLPGVQFAVADLKIKLDVCRSQITYCAKLADELLKEGTNQNDLYIETLVTKQFVTKTVNEIIWSAMQIVGMRSLSQGHLLERLHRDIRAATFHPPAEDLLKEVIGKKVLQVLPVRMRWV